MDRYKYADAYGRRCRELVRGSMFQHVVERALDHPDFVALHRKLINQLASERSPLSTNSTWGTIKIGTYSSLGAMRRALALTRALTGSRNMRIDDEANDLLDNVKIATEVEEVDLVIIRAADLGFQDCASYRQICRKAHSVGLESLPPEAAPILRMKYRDQPENECLHIAMKPIKDSYGEDCIFILRRPGYYDLCLSVACADSDETWDAEDLWVFRRK